MQLPTIARTSFLIFGAFLLLFCELLVPCLGNDGSLHGPQARHHQGLEGGVTPQARPLNIKLQKYITQLLM
jgi:hypothetical protein